MSIINWIILVSGDLHYPSSRLSSSQRPDVVPGDSIQEEATIFQESTNVAQSSPGIERESFIDPTMHRGENDNSMKANG